MRYRLVATAALVVILACGQKASAEATVEIHAGGLADAPGPEDISVAEEKRRLEPTKTRPQADADELIYVPDLEDVAFGENPGQRRTKSLDGDRPKSKTGRKVTKKVKYKGDAKVKGKAQREPRKRPRRPKHRPVKGLKWVKRSRFDRVIQTITPAPKSKRFKRLKAHPAYRRLSELNDRRSESRLFHKLRGTNKEYTYAKVPIPFVAALITGITLSRVS